MTLEDACPCSPVRPAVSLSSTVTGPGQLSEAVTTSTASPTSIRLDNGARTITNRLVTFVNGAATSASGFTYTAPANQTQTTFMLTRQASGAVIVPFVVVDACVEWQTFVGHAARAC